jgi:S1-C subfamily serine protease
LRVTKRIILTLPVLLFACICIYALPAYALTPFSGLEVANSEKTPGARVFGVAPGSPASLAGVQPGDVIVSIEGQGVKSLEDFVNISKAIRGKEKATISLDRQGKLFNVVLGKSPAKQKQAQPETGKSVAGAVHDRGGALGVLIRGGALVIDVVPGTAAEKAGIMKGDSIIEFNGMEVSTHSDLPQMVTALAPGTRVEVTIVREGEVKKLQVILGKREQLPKAAPSPQDRKEPPAPEKKKAQPKAQPEAQSPGDIDIPGGLGEL